MLLHWSINAVPYARNSSSSSYHIGSIISNVYNHNFLGLWSI